MGGWAVAARWDAGGGWMSGPVGRPAYQRVADDLRRQIAAGDLPVGSAIPSTAKLTKAYQVSYTVIRAARTARLAGADQYAHNGQVTAWLEART